jgi:glycosyltransferase involved in cell wall biosynthesis
MKKLPLVTIITSVFNQADYLFETIESVLNQDYPNLEYIVIDDGSTDHTIQILKSFGDRIRFEHQSNMGQATALNRGWKMAKGSLVGYLSADDILYPGAISKLVNLLEDDESIICVFPDSNLIDKESRVIKKNVCKPFDLTETIVRQECYIGPGAIFRRSAFNVIGYWKSDLKLAPDREFWIRLAACGRIQMCFEVLAGYRMHSQSISYKIVSEEISFEYIKVLNDYFTLANVPPKIKEKKFEAYGYAYLLIARNCFRAGRIKRGIELYKKACNHHKDLESLSIKIKILRNIISRPLRMIYSKFIQFLKDGN